MVFLLPNITKILVPSIVNSSSLLDSIIDEPKTISETPTNLEAQYKLYKRNVKGAWMSVPKETKDSSNSKLRVQSESSTNVKLKEQVPVEMDHVTTHGIKQETLDLPAEEVDTGATESMPFLTPKNEPKESEIVAEKEQDFEFEATNSKIEQQTSMIEVGLTDPLPHNIANDAIVRILQKGTKQAKESRPIIVGRHHDTGSCRLRAT